MTAAVYNSAGVSISSITSATIIDNGGGGTPNVLAAGWLGAGVSSITVNTSKSGSYVYVEVDEYSGVNTSTPVDQHVAAASVHSGATCSPNSLTPTQAGDLAIEYVANFTVSASPVQGTYSTSPSTTTTIEGNSSGNILALEGWSVDSGTSAITGTWTWSTSQSEQCGYLLLNPAAASTLVQRTACGSDSTQNLSCNLTSTIASGDVGIVTAAVYNSAGVSISSITNATVIDNGGGGTSGAVAAGWVGAGVSSVTINTSKSGSYVYAEVDEYAAVNTTTPVDQHVAAASMHSGATCSPNSLTPTQAGDLAIEYVANFTASASPAQGTYSTSPSTTTTIEGNSSGGILALEGWSVYSGTSAITGTWTWSTSQWEQCGFLLLNPASANPSPTPSPTPTGSYSYTNYTQIQNGQEWPSNFRPYCANATYNSSSPCPWNDTLPDNPQNLDPNSATIISSLFASSDNIILPGDFSEAGDYSRPIYLASTSDPNVTITCNPGSCPEGNQTIHIPSEARPSGGSDHHMGVVEPDGTEWDMYNASYGGGSSGTASYLIKTTIRGDGSSTVTDGGAAAAGMIRFDELSRGVVPHALFAVTACVKDGTSFQYPAKSAGIGCSSGTPPIMGARLQLTLTDAQINALALPAWEAAILHAMHDYGIYIGDTTNYPNHAAPGDVELRWESATQFISFGQTYPGSNFTGLQTGNWEPTGIDWKSDLRVVGSCYALETCSQ
ncbi:MAG: hypothetical protein ACRENA_05655 [Vulcanimicrobiaceae bacterium]